MTFDETFYGIHRIVTELVDGSLNRGQFNSQFVSMLSEFGVARYNEGMNFDPANEEYTL